MTSRGGETTLQPHLLLTPAGEWGFSGAHILHPLYASPKHTHTHTHTHTTHKRESGDHGPFNSWHRLPFLSLLTSSPESPSFYPALSEATGNFNIANYGGAQGYVNDDGSSFNYIHDNFFYQADGFKMVRLCCCLACSFNTPSLSQNSFF